LTAKLLFVKVGVSIPLRPVFVECMRPRRAFLQFLHHNHTPSPFAGLCIALFRATVSWYF
jgi:hypothetical protein